MLLIPRQVVYFSQNNFNGVVCLCENIGFGNVYMRITTVFIEQLFQFYWNRIS